MSDFKKGDRVYYNLELHFEPGGAGVFAVVEGVSPAGVTLKEYGLVSPSSLLHVSEPVSLSVNVKDSNPKDSIGVKKAPMSTVPCAVIMEIGLAMLEGALKYRRHNYRAIGVRASVYYDACMRHIMAWWEGEDLDPDSELNHITKALASLTVLRDAMINNKWVDDRPPSMVSGWVAPLNAKAKALIEKCPNPKEAYVREVKGENQ